MKDRVKAEIAPSVAVFLLKELGGLRGSSASRALKVPPAHRVTGDRLERKAGEERRARRAHRGPKETLERLAFLVSLETKARRVTREREESPVSPGWTAAMGPEGCGAPPAFPALMVYPDHRDYRDPKG